MHKLIRYLVERLEEISTPKRNHPFESLRAFTLEDSINSLNIKKKLKKSFQNKVNNRKKLCNAVSSAFAEICYCTFGFYSPVSSNYYYYYYYYYY
jgi:hypothetical protein